MAEIDVSSVLGSVSRSSAQRCARASAGEGWACRFVSGSDLATRSRGRIRPVVSDVLPFERVADAHRKDGFLGALRKDRLAVAIRNTSRPILRVDHRTAALAL